MTSYLKHRLIFILIGTLSFICSLFFIGSGIYIHLKAQIAQILLQKAWNETLNHNELYRPWPSADYYPFAELSTPYKNKLIVLNTVTGQALAFGPSFHNISSYPGEKGRSIISMHRDTHGRFLKKIKINDLISLKTKEDKNFFYQVNAITIVDSSKINLNVSSQEHELILYTCYPFDAVQPGGSMRYLVQAKLINQQKIINTV